jgi:hypothetical protein
MTRKTAQLLASAFVLVTAANAAAQIVSRPTPPPTVVADNEEWYRWGQPIPFHGALYYQAGAILHFDGNRMVPTGAHNGVPLYADVFLDPYSKIFVPLAGGLMQPYERKRDGEFAGTTGSQAPSFPVAIPAEVQPPTPVLTDEGREEPERSTELGTAGLVPAPSRGTSRNTHAFAPLDEPSGLNAVFIIFEGARWRPAGAPIPFDETKYRTASDYYGVPVFVDRDTGAAPRIYLPSRSGMVTPYTRVVAPVRKK